MTTSPIFAEAPHITVLRRMHLISVKDRPAVLRRILLVVAVGWLPLMLLCLVDSQVNHDAAATTFFGDIAVHARLLLAAPLLIACEYVVLPRLESIAKHLANSSLIASEDRDRYAAEVEKCHSMSARMRYSGEIALVAYVLAFIMLIAASKANYDLPGWQHSAHSSSLSLAGWWHLMISQPILLGLILGWLWRLIVWLRFLAFISRLGLLLIAVHPDNAAGLQFIAYTPRIFAPVGLALSIVVAGMMANNAVHHGLSPIDHIATPLITAAVITILFVFPPFIFTRVLVTAWRQGVFKYSDLASRIGKEFEEKWIGPGVLVDSSALSDPDFSSTTDLYSIVSNVYNMRRVLFDYQGAAAIVITALVPFVPVWLSAVPLKTLSKNLIGLFF